jgi:hypothetical protein
VSDLAINDAIAWGAPGRAAELLEEGATGAARALWRELLSGRWPGLQLPAGSPLGRELEAAGVVVQRFEVPHGVYALATFDMPAGLGVEAAPRLVELIDGLGEDDVGDLGGLRAGVIAAQAWLYRSLRADVSSHRHVKLGRVDRVAPTTRAGGRGTSAGLAGALALAWTLLGAERSRRGAVVAATGDLKSGRVCSVDFVNIKSRAAVRELPGLSCLYVPRENRGDVEQAVEDATRVVFVETVEEALEDLFGPPTPTWLPALDFLKAAELVQRLEIEQKHEEAKALAERLLTDTSDTAWQDDFERARARVSALQVLGINLTHAGEARRARACFEEIRTARKRMRPGLWNDVFEGAQEEVTAAREASALLDLLEPDAALAILDRFSSVADTKLERRAKIEVLGTRARVLSALGRLDEATRVSDAHLAVHLGQADLSWSSERICYRIDILFRRHARGQAGALAEVVGFLEAARRDNERVTDARARAVNEAYLCLWEVRLLAAHGRADHCRQLAGEPSASGGRFPDHYRHRFVGEALIRAGELDGGLAYLDEATAGISEGAGPFERIVLLSAAASAALARIEHHRDGWEDSARAFLEPLRDWNPRYVDLPGDDADATAWRATLEDALARLPY